MAELTLVYGRYITIDDYSFMEFIGQLTSLEGPILYGIDDPNKLLENSLEPTTATDL